MTPEERQLLTGLFDRVRTASAGPRDREAEALIADEVRSQPYAPYLLAQTVIVQEQALRAAADQLQQLQGRAQALESGAAQSPDPAGGSFLSGIGRSLFGGGEPPRPASAAPMMPRTAAPASPAWGQQGTGQQAWGQPPMQPAYVSPYAQPPGPAPWGQPQPSGGGSFLHGALGAAAGVAGGVLLADSLRGLFGGHNNGLGIGSGFGGGVERPADETIVNNYYGSDQGTQTSADDALQDSLQDGTYQADYPDDNQSPDPGNGGNDDSFNV